jgi:uncharacterized delta-60 repeat protein
MLNTHYKKITTFLLSVVILIGFVDFIFSQEKPVFAVPFIVDPTFLSGTGIGGFGVFDTEIQSDGKIVVGGGFTQYNGIPTGRIIRLNSNGTLDTGFTPSIGSGVVYAVEIQSDGKILIGGTFDHDLVRLNTDGTIDTVFQTNIGTALTGSGIIKDIKIQSDGKIILAGNFSTFNSVPFNSVLRLNSDGTIDPTFVTSGITNGGGINDIGIQSDGKIILVGNFNEFDGISINHIVRLLSNGSVDPAFTTNIGSGASPELWTVAIQTDDKIILGGDSETFNGQPMTGVIRLNADGTYDSSYNNNLIVGGDISDIKLQPDGKILIGGNISTISGNPYGNLVRLTSNGNLDTTFLASPSGFNTGGLLGESIYDIEVQSDGKVVVGGVFSEFDTISQGSLSRLVPADTTPPFVTIVSPSNGSTVGNTMTVSGTCTIGDECL